MISSRSSRRNNSSMLATACSSTLLLIAFLGNHVTDACSCFPIGSDSLCDEMLKKEILVHASFLTKEEVVDERCTQAFNGKNDQCIAYNYTAEIKEVFLTDGSPALTAGNTIQVQAEKASNLCGIEFQTDDEWLLELYAHPAGHYSSNLCGMNSLYVNEIHQATQYNQCFETISVSTLQLKGAPPLLSVSLPPKPTIKKAKISKTEKKKLCRTRKAKDGCIKMRKPVICGEHACQYSNQCVAGNFGWDATNCELKSTPPPLHVYLPPPPKNIADDCPSTQLDGKVCIELYDPVMCSKDSSAPEACEYSNKCIAETFGWDLTQCEPKSPPLPYLPKPNKNQLSLDTVYTECPLSKPNNRYKCALDDGMTCDYCKGQQTGVFQAFVVERCPSNKRRRCFCNKKGKFKCKKIKKN